MTIARRLVAGALDALFPPRCIGCSDFGAFICEACLASAPRADGNRCSRCWRIDSAFRCWSCEQFTPAFTALRSAFAHDGTAREAVHVLKYRGVSALAPAMATEMTSALRDWSPPIDAIVPVPLGWLRKRTRGYNQSELLAGEIARATGLRLERHALRRTRRTAPQARQPDAASRRANVRDAFGAGSRPVSGNVLLIDDVSTTGATLDSCARAVLASGATTVFAMTFARED